MKRILILTLLAVTAVACSKPEETKTNAPVNAPPANSQANTEAPVEPIKEEVFTSGANPRADLISAAQKRQKLPFWSAKVLMESNSEVFAEMKYAAPDSYYFKTALGEAVIIGDSSYSNEDGTWKKEAEGADEYIKQQINQGIAEGVKNLKDVGIAGKEKVNGKDATIYFYKSGSISAKIWIADGSGLELKNEIEAEAETGEKIKRTTVYDYETPVKIETPKID
jgi:hypothetical protein